MADVELTWILWEDFKKKVEKSNPTSDSDADRLVKQGLSMPLEQLLNINHQPNEDFNIFLDSLILCSVYKSPKTAIKSISKLSESYKFLVSKAANHSQTFLNAYLEDLFYITSFVTSLDDILLFAGPLKDLKTENINVTNIINSLSTYYTNFMWEKSIDISSSIVEKGSHLRSFFIKISQTDGIGLNIESIEDRALDLLIEYIEAEIDFVDLITNNSKIKQKNFSLLKELIGYSKHLKNVSDCYVKRIQKFEEIIGFTEVKKPEIPVEETKNYSGLPFFTKSETSIYARDHDDLNISLYRGKLQDGTQIVVKIYTKLADTCDFFKFTNEIKIFEKLSSLATPENAFLKFYGASNDGKKLILLMESCEMDLMTKITNMRKTKTQFSDENLAEIARTLISAFAELETLGIFHRDIKPHNILINSNLKTKITDFNVSEIKADLAQTRTTNVHPIQGTDGYMAPELIKVANDVNNQSKSTFHNPGLADVFSLGLTLLQIKALDNLSTLNLEENNSKLLKIVADVQPHWFSTLLSHMLGADYKSRSTFKQLLAYLPEVEAGTRFN